MSVGFIYTSFTRPPEEQASRDAAWFFPRWFGILMFPNPASNLNNFSGPGRGTPPPGTGICVSKKSFVAEATERRVHRGTRLLHCGDPRFMCAATR
jgi:hypothetical protein